MRTHITFTPREDTFYEENPLISNQQKIGCIAFTCASLDNSKLYL